MTAEEKVRMNELCAAIQEETEYVKFAAMLREMTQLLERKELRRFPNQPKVVLTRTKPSTSMPARVNKVLPSLHEPKPRVEISIPAADHLFREIRIENHFMAPDGKPVMLNAGEELTLTLEAEGRHQP